MTCAMKREAWTWYLPSHLVPANILCSRCEPCTNTCKINKNYKQFDVIDLKKTVGLKCIFKRTLTRFCGCP